MQRAYKIFTLYITYTLVICAVKFAVKEFSPIASILMTQTLNPPGEIN